MEFQANIFFQEIILSECAETYGNFFYQNRSKKRYLSKILETAFHKFHMILINKKYWWCFRGLCLQAKDALGLWLKPTGYRVILVGVSESGSQKSLPENSDESLLEWNYFKKSENSSSFRSKKSICRHLRGLNTSRYPGQGPCEPISYSLKIERNMIVLTISSLFCISQ